MDGVRPIRLPSTALGPGDVLGRYELLIPIAKGGMGQVWAARLRGTRGFQKLVAVKTILPSNEDSGHLQSMLFEEASLASLVRHPNVVETLDLGERDDGTLYLVMEWVAGEPLDFILRAAQPAGGLPVEMLVHFVLQALRGLHAVHEARNSRGEALGIVHRDVSLQNLLVTYEGMVKLIDFGIAKATQQMSKPTEDGLVKGKFGYMSPEQLRSEPVDARADLFSLGVVLYRATTGEHPFHADNVAATMRNILMKDPKRPTEIAPQYPRALEDVVLKVLAKNKSARFGSAQEMTIALERAVPQALHANIDKECVALMHRLFKERIAERERALQLALTAADRGWGARIGEIGQRFPRSQSTMRAVSREMADGVTEEAPAEAEPAESADGRRDRRRRRAARLLVMSAGVGALLTAGFVLPGNYRLRGRPGGTPSASLPGALMARPAAPGPSADVEVRPDPAASASSSSASLVSSQPPAATLTSNQSPRPAATKKHGARPNDATNTAPAVSTAVQAPAVDAGGPAADVDPLSRRK
jgi:serine/threonine-protein kinase